MRKVLCDFLAVTCFMYKVKLQRQISPHLFGKPTELKLWEDTRHQCYKQLHSTQQHSVSVQWLLLLIHSTILLHQFWHVGSCAGLSQPCHILTRSVRGFGAPGGWKSLSPIDWRCHPYNSVRTNVLYCDAMANLQHLSANAFPESICLLKSLQTCTNVFIKS